VGGRIASNVNRSSHSAAIEARKIARALPIAAIHGNLVAKPITGNGFEEEIVGKTVRPLLVSSGVALVAFAAIAGSWTLLPLVCEVDKTVALRLNDAAHASPAEVQFFLAVTFLGTSLFLVPLSIAIVVVLLLRGRWRLAAAWVITQLVGLVLIEKTKLAFDRLRPSFNGEFTTEDSYSFPSGHALGSLVAFGMLAYLFAIHVRRPAARRAGIVIAAALVLLIGFSRMFLGVHYFTDVLGGYALGAAWLAFALALIEDIRARYGGVLSGSNGNAGQ